MNFLDLKLSVRAMDEESRDPLSNPHLSRKWIVIAVCVGVLMGLSCIPLVNSMMFEDWMHHGVIQGTLGSAQGISSKAPWDFFVFMDGDAGHEEKLASFWFTHPDSRVAFWRPLSSLLIAGDHQLFGLKPLGYLLHSTVWYGALCLAVAALLQRFLPGVRGGIAAVLFAVLGTHHETVVWFAAMNALVCAALGGFALLAHVRFRDDGWRPGRWLAPLLFVAALSGGEAALGMLGYLIAFEFFRSESLRSKLMALAPTLVITMLWLVLYRAQGYGAHLSGNYIDPFSEPFRYLAALPLRLSFTRSVLLLGAPALVWPLAPDFRLGFAFAGMIAVALAFVVLRKSLAKLADREQRALSWLGLGMVLSILPQLAGALGARSYLIPSIGAVALVGHLAVYAWQGRSKWAKSGAVFLLFLHGVVGVVLWPSMSLVYSKLIGVQEEGVVALGLKDESASERDYLLVTADALTAYFAPMQFAAQTGKNVGSWRVLSVAECDQRLRRTGPKTFELEAKNGAFMASPTEEMTRAPETPFVQGEVVELSDIRVEILRLGDSGLPDLLGVEVKSAGQMPELWASIKGKMTAIPLPEVGASVELPWAAPM